ncbi:M4 family metallopeptidase [Paenibacillus larvae]|nr:M4 family metallopeptidase [Paenibacillus larvae]
MALPSIQQMNIEMNLGRLMNLYPILWATLSKNKGWLIGEDVSVKGEAFRSMQDPTRYDQPIRTRICTQVHLIMEESISTVELINKAFYLLAEGGTHRGVTVSGIGRDEAVEIYYHALTHYLTPYANFSTMRVAAIQARKRFIWR